SGKKTDSSKERANQVRGESGALWGFAQQDAYGSCAAIALGTLTESQYSVVLCQPAPDRLLQDRLAIGRAKPLAVNNMHTAPLLCQAGRDEIIQLHARRIQVKAMQVNPGVGPALALAQLARQVGIMPGPHEARVIVLD